MKTKLALSLLVAALLPACTTTKTTSTKMSGDAKSSRYANNSLDALPPPEGPETDIPSEGPHDVNRNPAYMPTPLLRQAAIGSL